MSTDDRKPSPDGSEPSESDVRVVRLALLADNLAPVGARPTLLEIQAWHKGHLPAARAAEVKSHVARDPQCFAMWSDILSAERSLAPDLHDPAAPSK